MIQALLFDLGDVIVGLDFDRAYRRLEAMTGLKKPEITGRIAAADLAVAYETGSIDSAEFHRRFCEAVGIAMPFADFAGLWGNMFAEEPLLEEALFEEWARDYQLVLLSNTNELHYEWIAARYSPLRHFHATVLSYEVGTMKPDRRIYKAAVAAAGVAPEACFFTDDKQANVEGARALRIQAVRFVGREDLLGDLGRLGVVMK